MRQLSEKRSIKKFLGRKENAYNYDMVNAQEYLDSNYPKEQRKEITELELSDKGLEGSLDLSDFTNLKKLYLSNNPFLIGSLECLKLYDLKNLSYLNISFTKFDSGLEYLPDSVSWVIFKENEYLRRVFGNYSIGNYLFWKVQNQELIKRGKKIMELETTLTNLNSVLTNSHAQNPVIDQGLKVVSLRDIDSWLKELKKVNQEYYQQVFLKEPKELKEKIIKFCSSFVSEKEKELLKELINAQLEFSRASKSKERRLENIGKCRKNFNRIYKKMEDVLEETEICEVEIILAECVSLVEIELELENRFGISELIKDLKEFLKGNTCQIEIVSNK